MNFKRMFFICAGLLLCFGMTVAASEDNNMDDLEIYLNVFDLEEEDLDYGTHDSQTYSEYRQVLDEVAHDANVFGDFSFSGGLDKTRFSTFADCKSLTGFGEEGMIVGLMVYNEDLEVIDVSFRILGASGLYSEEVDLGDNQQQCISVAVKDGDRVVQRVYKVTTMEEATKSILENLEVNFTPVIEVESEEIPEAPVFEMELPVLVDLEL